MAKSRLGSWDADADARSKRDGWLISEASSGELQLQRVDDDDREIFGDNDDSVHIYVYQRALMGDQLAIRAITYLAVNKSPDVVGVDLDRLNLGHLRSKESGLPPGMYLELFHGRKSPNVDMDDWGCDGPVFGPLKFCHVTYKNVIELSLVNIGDEAWTGLRVVGDLIYYDGVYYGDYSVFDSQVVVDIQRNLISRLVPFQSALAIPPEPATEAINRIVEAVNSVMGWPALVIGSDLYVKVKDAIIRELRVLAPEFKESTHQEK